MNPSPTPPDNARPDAGRHVFILRPRADKYGWTLLRNGIMIAGGSFNNCVMTLSSQQPAPREPVAGTRIPEFNTNLQAVADEQLAEQSEKVPSAPGYDPQARQERFTLSEAKERVRQIASDFEKRRLEDDGHAGAGEHAPSAVAGLPIAYEDLDRKIDAEIVAHKGYPNGTACYGAYSPNHSFEYASQKCYYCGIAMTTLLEKLSRPPSPAATPPSGESDTSEMDSVYFVMLTPSENLMRTIYKKGCEIERRLRACETERDFVRKGLHEEMSLKWTAELALASARQRIAELMKESATDLMQLRAAEAEREDIAAAVKVKDEALTAAEDCFRHYAALHAAKNTPEGDNKAIANELMRRLCRAALSPVTTAHVDSSDAPQPTTDSDAPSA